MDLLAAIDRDTEGKYDVTPLYADPELFAVVRERLAADARDVTHVASIEALGLPLAGAIAADLGAGTLVVRKAGGYPKRDADLLTETVEDYSGDEKTLELPPARVPDGARVLLVDDWVETGGQARGACRLLERAGAEVVGLAAIRGEHGDGAGDLFDRYGVTTL